MLNVIVELCIAYIQYFSTLVDTHEVSFPSAWKDPMYYVSTINFSFDIFSAAFPSLKDIRVYFTVISVVGPLVFVLLGLLFLVDRLVVVWYFLVLTGVMLLLAGTSGSIISATTNISITSSDAQLMLYIGGGICLFCFVMFLIARRMRASVGVVQSRRKVMLEATKEFQVMASLWQLLIIVALLAFALIVTGYISGVDQASNSINSVGAKFALGIALSAAVIGGLMLLWLLVSLCSAGRMIQWEIKEWLQSGFLRVLLLSMSLAYIPIGNGVFLMFNCNTFTCGAGEQLLDTGTVVVLNSTAHPCVPCVIGAAQMCPTAFQATLCRGISSSRLEYDTSVACDNVRQFFWPAAGLMIVAYVLGVPLMFFRLVQLVTTTLKTEFPVKSILGSESMPQSEHDHLLWLKKAGQSQNVAKFLFQPFEYEYRYVRLFQLIQKLVIVGTTTYIVRGGVTSPEIIALGCACAVHFIAFVLLAYHRPFLSNFESGLSIVMAFTLTVSCVMAILLQQNVVIPNTVYIIVIILNGTIPLVAIIVGLYLEWHTSQDDEDEKEKEEMMRLQSEVDKKIEEEEAAKAAARKAHEDAIAKAEAEAAEARRAREEAIAKAEAEQAAAALAAEEAAKAAADAAAQALAEAEAEAEADGDKANDADSADDSAGKSAAPRGEAEMLEIKVTTPQRSSKPPSPPPSRPNPSRNVDSQSSGQNKVQQQPAHPSPGKSSVPSLSVHHLAAPTPNRASGRSNDPLDMSMSGSGVSPFATPRGHETEEDFNYRRLRRQKLRAEARKKVRNLMDQELLELNEKQGDVDMLIDRQVKSRLQGYLMAGGVIACIAFSMCILGLISRSSAVVTISTDHSASFTQELAGYRNWTAFVENCCCLVNLNSPQLSSVLAIEKWMCLNGRIKERARSTYMQGVSANGFAIRPMCSPTFATDCSVVIDAITGDVSLSCTNPRNASELQLW